MSEVPEIRIGTTEREAAIEKLTAHFSAGRLTVAEFEERTSLANAARTKGELDLLFTDLPDAAEAAPPAPAKRQFDWPTILVGLTPIIALLLFFSPLPGGWLWFLLIPAVGIVVGGVKKATGD